MPCRPDLKAIASCFPLPWSVCVCLLSLKSDQARKFYAAEALRCGWSVRQLSRQIESQFHERTALSRNKAAMLARSQCGRACDVITPEEELKDLFVLEFLSLKDEYSESDLEEALIRHLEGFLHVCLNYAREHWVQEGENPPVGLILAAQKDDALAHYALEGLAIEVMAAEYRTVLPDEGSLAVEIDRTREFLALRNWFIGCHIQEYELRGEDRSQYGERLFDLLASRLTALGLPNCDRRQIYRYVDFYRAYPQIVRALSPQFRGMHPRELLPRTRDR